MALTRWSATLPRTRELVGIQDEVNRLFDSFFGGLPQRSDLPSFITPPVDVEETSEEFVLRADLPGIDSKNVKISLMGDTLTLRGERKQETTRNGGGQHRVERLYGSFERSFVLNAPVRADQVQATYRDGVLEIHVPKAEEAKVREIEVKVG